MLRNYFLCNRKVLPIT